MACDNEFQALGAALLALAAACATVETGIGAIACAAALWSYYNAADAYNTCRQQNGLADITDHVNQIYADATTMQQHADAESQTA